MAGTPSLGIQPNQIKWFIRHCWQVYLCKDNKIITPGKMHPFYSVYFVQWPGLAGAIGRDPPGRGRGEPGRCGSFTGAWCLPRPRRSRYGHNKQISLEGKQKCLAAAWLLPGRGDHAFWYRWTKRPRFTTQAFIIKQDWFTTFYFVRWAPVAGSLIHPRPRRYRQDPGRWAPVAAWKLGGCLVALLWVSDLSDFDNSRPRRLWLLGIV